MKLSITTLACPDWSLATVCEKAREYGYDGVDFRGLGESLDVTTMPEFTTGVSATARMLADHGLAVSGLSSGIRVCDVERRAACVEEARRTIGVALALGATDVRVFGEGRPDRDGYAAAAGGGVECVREILALPDAGRLRWNFETHDHWTRSTDCRRLLDAIVDPPFGAAWDVCHTVRVAGESASQTLDALGDRLRYVHVKDAARTPGPATMADGWRYVLPGTGEIALDRAVAALRRHDYDGWLMFEHEKRWHPELEEPEVALPAFVRWAEAVGLRPGGG